MPGLYHLFGSEAVTVQHFPINQPRDGLQTDVGVRTHGETAVLRDISGPMWSAKHQAPTIRRPLRERARRTRIFFTGSSRLSDTSTHGALGWPQSTMAGEASVVVT